MSTSETINNLGMIDPDKIKPGEIFLLDLNYKMWPDDTCKLFKKDNHLVVWKEFFNPFDKVKSISQKEFPLASLPWFIDTIEDKFWRHKPDLNMQPGDVSEKATIDDEEIGINPSRNCCAENLFGYSFWNASRKSYLSKTGIHDWQIPRYMLEEGLLDELKKISTNLGLKDYS